MIEILSFVIISRFAKEVVWSLRKNSMRSINFGIKWSLNYRIWLHKCRIPERNTLNDIFWYKLCLNKENISSKLKLFHGNDGVFKTNHIARIYLALIDLQMANHWVFIHDWNMNVLRVHFWFWSFDRACNKFKLFAIIHCSIPILLQYFSIIKFSWNDKAQFWHSPQLLIAER